MSFGERIKTIRDQQSQKSFAQALGVSRTTLQYWEHDKTTPTGDILLRLYKIFGVNLNWLLSGEGSPHVDGDQRSTSMEEKVVNMGARVAALEKAIADLKVA